MKYTLLLLAVLAIGCRASPEARNSGFKGEPKEITVSAAVSLKDAFNEIAAEFKTRTGTTVTFNFGASGALQKQIESGAPVDLFASAGARQMNELQSKNLIDSASRRDFARNSLVLVAARDSTLELNTFADLVSERVQKIAVGNPRTVPAGEYAAELFTSENLADKLAAKLIFAEDVRQVLSYVARGETDVGVVYATDALAFRDSVKVLATANEASHSPILYPLAIVADSKNKLTAMRFVEFIMSTEGQGIMRKYGFSATDVSVLRDVEK